MSHNPARIARYALSFVALLFVFTVLALPPRSRATQERPQSNGKKKSGKDDFVPGQVLVRFKSERIAKQTANTASVVVDGQELPITIERFDGADLIPGLRLAHVAPEATLQAIEALRQRSDVMYAEPNYILHADLTPNDTFFGDLYALTKIGAPTAWNTQQGSANVVVGVIDQGIDLNHQDLNANRFINPAPGSIPGFAGDVNGYNFVNNNGTVFDGNLSEDHGTHVAGIVGAVGNNGIGVVGVNWTVRLMSLRFLDGAGSGSTSDAVRACNYARQMRELYVSSGGSQGANIRVLNNSYGGGGFTNSFLDAITALNNAGILFVAAAGNTSDDPEPDNEIVAHYPSSYNVPNVISVANTNSSDGLNSGSHFGVKSVHLGAPGTSIRSTVPGNNYLFFTGTSMATPHVSGAAALLLAQNPNLTVAKLKNLLLLNGDVVPGLVDKTVTGRRLNVGNSMAALAENDVTAPGTPTNFQKTGQNGRIVNLSWNASGDDGAAGTAALYQLTFTDGWTGAVSSLKTIVPVASGAAQAATVTLPFRHTRGFIKLKGIDNVGNEGTPAEIFVTVPFAAGDPYAMTITKTVALSTGGTKHFGTSADDDRLKDLPLPFPFPFFGTNHTTVTVSTNGNLFFSPAPHRTDPTEADDVPSSVGELARHKMISGLWDDIDLRASQRADAGLYVTTPSANRVIFRWQGVPCNFNGSICTGGGPVNFEIELQADGTIISRYGAGNTSLFPVVGISGGEPEAYVATSHTSEATPINLTNAVELVYIPRTVMNPLDNAYFFTNQQYFDLLGRGADVGGLNFWADQILECNTADITCLVNRRVRVSAAFFVENEFQRTGSFVYRSYKGGLGRLVEYPEFIADRPLIVEGPNLEATKQAYALAFVQRAEFVNKYNGQNTADSFVDALIATIQTSSGVSLAGERSALIATYNTGGNQNQSRALAMRQAIDNTAFFNAEYNRSFVLMQYFGYLGRNPDLGGFNFWQNVLNNLEPNNYRGMVCSFITSTEYQQRFSDLVPHSNQECPLVTRN